MKKGIIQILPLIAIGLSIIAVGATVMNIDNPTVLENIGATIRTLPMFKATSTPYSAIEPRLATRGLYLYENATTTKDMYANAFHGDGSDLVNTSNWEVNTDGYLTPSTTIDILLPSNATTTSTHNVGSLGINSEYFTDLTGTNLELDTGRLDVIDNPVFSGGITMNSATTTDSMYVGGDLTVAGDTNVVDITQQNTTVNGTINVTGASYLASVSGNVGIGTTDPVYVLDVETVDNTVASFVSTDSVSSIRLEDDDTASYLISAEGLFGIRRGASNAIGSAHLAIDVSGNVGIGTDSPNSILEIKQNEINGEGASLRIINDGSAVGTGQIASLVLGRNFDERNFKISSESTLEYGKRPDLVVTVNQLASGDTHTEVLRIKNSGNVGIGTTNPLQKLQVNGGVAMNSATTTDSLYVGGKMTLIGNATSTATIDAAQFCISGTSCITAWPGSAGGITDINSQQLGQLSDVSTSTLAAWDILNWTGSTWANVATTTFLMSYEIDTSAKIAAIVDDETGTGLMCFNDTPTFTTGINVEGYASSTSITVNGNFDVASNGNATSTRQTITDGTNGLHIIPGATTTLEFF